jgi:hypothetical protein
MNDAQKSEVFEELKFAAANVHESHPRALFQGAVSLITDLRRDVAILSDAVIPATPEEDSDGTVTSRAAFSAWNDARRRADAAEAQVITLQNEIARLRTMALGYSIATKRLAREIEALMVML